MTKTAQRAAVQATLARHEPGQLLSGADLTLVRALLDQHPRAAEKIGAGVRGIRVQRALYGKKGFIIERVDGTTTDFSYLKCLGVKMDPVLKALRFAVDAQILAERSRHGSSPFACPVTGELTDPAEAHVDHEPPQTFDRLVKEFLTREQLQPADIEVLGHGDGEQVKWLKDEALAQRWRLFHQEHARLRLISRRANLSIVPAQVRKTALRRARG